MKKIKSLILLIPIFFISFVSTGISEESGNYRKGMYYYKTTCKQCHTLSEIGEGKTKQSHKECISEKKWITNFHKKKFDMYGCKKIEEKICTKNLKHVYKYLHSPSKEEPDVTNCRVIGVNHEAVKN